MSYIIGPSFISLQVPDLEKAKDFYTRVFDFEIDPSGPPHAVVFKSNPIQIAVRESNIKLDVVTKLGWGIAIWIAVIDINALKNNIQSEGVSLVQDITQGPFGDYMTVEDLNGYLLTFHQPIK